MLNSLKKKMFWNIVVFLVRPSYGPEGGALPFGEITSVPNDRCSDTAANKSNLKIYPYSSARRSAIH